MTTATVHAIPLEQERSRRRLIRDTETMFQSLEMLCEALEVMASHPPYRYLLSVATGLAQLKADLYRDHSNGGLSERDLMLAADILAGFKATLQNASRHVIT
jgi:hypothetical protein